MGFLVSDAGLAGDTPKNNGATPVFIASQKGHLDIVRFLVSDAGLAGDTPMNNGDTPRIYGGGRYQHARQRRENRAALGAGSEQNRRRSLAPRKRRPRVSVPSITRRHERDTDNRCTTKQKQHTKIRYYAIQTLTR